jgi:hypothetical protein
MFRTIPLCIIRSFSLYTQQWYMSYRFVDSFRAPGSGWNCSSVLILLERCLQTCMTYTTVVCAVKNSWWWAEELSETCRVSFQSKFGKLVRLVGFIVRTSTLFLSSRLYVDLSSYRRLTAEIIRADKRSKPLVTEYTEAWCRRPEAVGSTLHDSHTLWASLSIKVMAVSFHVDRYFLRDLDVYTSLHMETHTHTHTHTKHFVHHVFRAQCWSTRAYSKFRNLTVMCHFLKASLEKRSCVD